jgi:hypothetical protein
MSDDWEGYSSEFMFPAEGTECICADDHDATQHGYDSCQVDGCPCPAYWEHT